MSAAVDVYAAMIRFEKKLRLDALKLSPVERLADNCPRCYGPTVPGKMREEPDCVVCLDGNFQNQRHMASSAEPQSSTLHYPPLFIKPEELNVWKDHLNELHSAGTGRAPASVGNGTHDEFIVSPTSSFKLLVQKRLSISFCQITNTTLDSSYVSVIGSVYPTTHGRKQYPGKQCLAW